MTTEDTVFLLLAFALVFFLGFVLGTIIASRTHDDEEEAKAKEDRKSWKEPVPQRQIKEVKLTVADSVAPPPPPDPNEDPVAKADRERIERLQREEAARR